MKKYMVPTMDVVELKAATLLAGSGDQFNTTLSDETPEGTVFHARNFGVWDDDEEQ